MATPVDAVLWLDDPRAQDSALAGAKASTLAAARANGFPIIPGFVLPTSLIETSPMGGLDIDAEVIVNAWSEISRAGTQPVIVRSSSTVEDGTSSSMAGVFESVAGVRDRTTFGIAVEKVLGSSNGAPMAVLVQREIEASRGGVAFGADPLTGRTDRRLIVAIDGTPGPLVSGRATGTRYTLTDSGRVVQRSGDPAGTLTWGQRRALTRLSAHATRLFGSAQDIEWAFDRDGALWMLQSRPITAIATASKKLGPRLGPGPIAETFPDPLASLEQDLWVEPLRDAIKEAVLIAGAASKRKLAGSPVIALVGGRPAMDLDLFGLAPQRSFLYKLDPRPSLRRLRASWRVGRLRTALPALAQELVRAIDMELASVPQIGALDDATLLGILHSSRRRLIAIHGHEVLAGLMMSKSTPVTSAAGSALGAVVTARHRGANDAEIIASDPTALALIPPRIPSRTTLPPTPSHIPDGRQENDPLGQAREDLRLRARWMQELTARTAFELGHRLTKRGILTGPDMIRWLHADELGEIVAGNVLPMALQERVPRAESAPLPSVFRLTTDGRVVAADSGANRDGQGAGGGRTTGPVRRVDEEIRSGDVLVVQHLDPKLASVLPGLGGLVAETGSVLSHLAILAREYGIPTVVGVHGALDRFPPGATVVVDGTAGEVLILDEKDTA
jgi:pyruvate,water dikinase